MVRLFPRYTGSSYLWITFGPYIQAILTWTEGPQKGTGVLTHGSLEEWDIFRICWCQKVDAKDSGLWCSFFLFFPCFLEHENRRQKHIQLGHCRCQGWRRSWNPMVWISLAAAILKSCPRGVLDVVIHHGWVPVNSFHMGMDQTR